MPSIKVNFRLKDYDLMMPDNLVARVMAVKYIEHASQDGNQPRFEEVGLIGNTEVNVHDG